MVEEYNVTAISPVQLHPTDPGRIRLGRVAAATLLLLVSAARAAEIDPPLETRHYVIHSDLNDDLTRELATRLDAMYDEYARRLAGFSQPDNAAKFQVRLFARRIDYMKFTKNRFPNTGGVFMSGRNTLAAFLEGQGRDGLRRTLQHEAFHQFAYQAIGTDLPVWLNEGLAQVFEEGVWTGREFVLGQVPVRRLRQLNADIAGKRLTDFSDFLSLTDARWAAGLNDRTAGATQYNQAWAMVQFLIFSTNADGEPLHRQRLLNWLRDLHDKQPANVSFVTNFGTNTAGFRKHFDEWAGQLKASELGDYIERQETLADLVALLNDRGIKFDDVAQLKQQLAKTNYRLSYTRGPISWTSAADARTYLRDLTGRDFRSDELFFQSRVAAPLPDIICRPTPSVQLRTKFFSVDGKIEREVLVEPR